MVYITLRAPAVPSQLGGGDPVRERQAAAEIVFRIEVAQGVGLGADGDRMRAEPFEGEVQRVAAMIHGNAATRVATFTPPIRPPLTDAARVRGAEGLQGNQVNATDTAAVDQPAHGLDHGRVLVIVAREKHALCALGVFRQGDRLFRGHRDWLLAQDMKATIERRVRNAGVSVGRRGDVHEVDPARLRLQHFKVVAVDASLRKIARCRGAPRLVTVDDRYNFEIPGADASFGVNRRVSLASNEAITDQGAT